MKRIMKRIIIDTNFFLIPIQFHVDIFSEFHRLFNFEYRLCIFEETINELKHIMETQKQKHRKAAQFGLKLIKLKNIHIIKSEKKDVDTLILENAAKDDVVATVDLALKRELIKKQIPVVFLRKKQFLELVIK